MKKIIVCLALLLILPWVMSACAPATAPGATEPSRPIATQPPTQPETEPPTEPPAPEPIFDPAPALSQTAVTVQGQRLEAVYEAESLLWICLSEEMTSAVVEPEPVSGRGTSVFAAEDEEGSLTVRNDDPVISRGGQPVTLPAPPIYDGTHWYLPLELLTEGLTPFADTEENHLYFTRCLDAARIPEGINVPILMYHAVSDNVWGIAELFVSPDDLREQLLYLRENGYTPIFFEELEQVDQIEKPVILTFDDGYEDNFTELLPILEEFQTKATVFVIADHLGLPTKMTVDQCARMASSPYVSIQSHTMTHPDLDRLDEAETVYELEQSQLLLTRITGKQPFILCYPTGLQTSLTREVAARYYSMGVLMTGNLYTTGCDPFLIPRFYVSRYCDIGTFAGKLSDAHSFLPQNTVE